MNGATLLGLVLVAGVAGAGIYFATRDRGDLAALQAQLGAQSAAEPAKDTRTQKDRRLSAAAAGADGLSNILRALGSGA